MHGDSVVIQNAQETCQVASLEQVCYRECTIYKLPCRSRFFKVEEALQSVCATLLSRCQLDDMTCCAMSMPELAGP